MKILYLVDKLCRSLAAEGLKDTIKDLVYWKRSLVIIEKQITAEPRYDMGDMQLVFANESNFREQQKRYKINLQLCKSGAVGLLLCQGEKLLGFQFWTRDDRLNVLKRFGICLNEDEAYLFDFFVFPRYRGTKVPRILSSETHNILVAEGVKKIYGFFFMDNIKSLWWHRAILKCKEIRRVTSSQFVIFKITDRKFRINL